MATLTSNVIQSLKFSLNLPNHIRSRIAQPATELQHHLEAGSALLVFQEADGAGVAIGFLGQLFVRQPGFSSEPPEYGCKGCCRGLFGHTQRLRV